MACKFDHPDCLNCPYEDCTASVKDIFRQWHYCKGQRQMDNPDSIPKIIGSPVRVKPIGTSYILTKSYEKSEKGKVRKTRYFRSEKGKAAQKRYDQSEKGKERWKRYYQRKKIQRMLEEGIAELKSN